MIAHTGALHSFLFPSLLWRMPSKKIFLTFDDGPHDRATNTVLDVLQEEHIAATFFLTGKNIPGREPIVRAIDRQGHSIGIHSYTHRRVTALSYRETVDELQRTTALLAPLVTQRIRLFRPPYGFFVKATVRAAHDHGVIPVMWTCLTGDYRGGNIDRIVFRSVTKLRGGAILVFHDNTLTESIIGPVLRRTITEIRSRGFEFGAIR